MHSDKKWQIRSEEKLFSRKIFDVFEIRAYLPSKDLSHEFYSIHLHDWINVFAVTPDDDVILVKQHRLGKDIVTVEVPAGAMIRGEDPVRAAARELEEETGYIPGKLVLLRQISVNPAIQNNTCYFFIALDCRKEKYTSFDAAEEIELLIMKKSELFDPKNSGLIDNSLSFLAVMLARDYFAKGL